MKILCLLLLGVMGLSNAAFDSINKVSLAIFSTSKWKGQQNGVKKDKA